jgi:ABC-type uncharacterized transport system substrate-binding protein
MLALVRQVLPGLARVCHLGDASTPVSQRNAIELETASASLGLQVQSLAVRTADELEEALVAAQVWGATALITGNGALFVTIGFGRMPKLAGQYRLPDFYFPRREPVDASGLWSYGPNPLVMIAWTALHVWRLLDGKLSARTARAVR